MSQTRIKVKRAQRAEVIGDIDPRQGADLQASANAIPSVLTGLEKSAFELRMAVQHSNAGEVRRQADNISEGVLLLRKLIYG